MTRSATRRPPLHDKARAPEQTLRVLPELQRPEVSLKLERQHRDGVLECSQHGELSRKLTKRIKAGHETTESTIQRGQRAKSAL